MFKPTTHTQSLRKDFCMFLKVTLLSLVNESEVLLDKVIIIIQ